MTTSTFSSFSVSVAIAYISGGFFLSSGKSRPRRLDESLWVASENIFNSIFCQLLVPYSLSFHAISIFLTYDEYAYVLTARCSYAPRYALCFAFGLPSPLFSLPQSQMNILKKEKTPLLPRRNLFFAFAYFVGNFRVEQSLHLCIR